MREVTIARNYAETLLSLAKHAGAPEAWGTLMDEATAALGTPSIEAVMMSPRVTKERKVEIIRLALQGAPSPFILFLAAVVKRGRQMLLPQIADEYRTLVDVQLNRVRAGRARRRTETDRDIRCSEVGREPRGRSARQAQRSAPGPVSSR